MEAKLRQILSDTLAPESGREPNLAEAIRRRFAPLGGSTSALPRKCRSASRRNLTSDRSRYQCHFRIDAAEAASGSAGLGGGATACDALHDKHQSDRVLYGIAMLPAGRRRTALAAAAEAMFAEDLAGRVPPYDGAGAARHAEIVVARRRIGNPIEAFDVLIAATASTAGASVATRDTGGFDGCGLTLIDPWLSP
jgi:predicted nucleic acid-binding protein